MTQNSTRTLFNLGLSAVLALAGAASQAQVLIDEQFAGGASTTGFTITDGPDSDCSWTYAPSGLNLFSFSVDGGGALPQGAGFDSDFVFIDSDACGDGAVTVNTYLTSAAFDAAQPGDYLLSFSHQFRARLESLLGVEVYNGSTWVQVANWDGPDEPANHIGYPNPAVRTILNITAAAAGAANAQVRFQFSSAFDWWWALDNIVLERAACLYPDGLAATAITLTGATIGWTDNGAPGYAWEITTGDLPNGSNAVASGNGANTTASGLMPGTPYMVFVRAVCTGGGSSPWSPGVTFLTAISNDECAGAIPLTVNTGSACDLITHGTVNGATDSGLEDCVGTANDDVWYSFTATATTHYVQILNGVGTSADLVHALWSGGCGTLALVENSCSDDDYSAVEGLTVGEAYYVQVFSYGTDATNTQFDLCVSTPNAAPPANDECANAVALTVNPTNLCTSVASGTVDGATDSGIDTDCGGTADDDIWYSFVATGFTQSVRLMNITGSTTDLYHAVWSNTCGFLAIVEESCSDAEQSLPTGLTTGETYYLQVYSYSEEPRNINFDVCVTNAPSVGITEHSADQALRVFPNPTTDRLFVTYDGRDAVNVKVVDLTGKPVLERAMAKSIAVDGLADGAYLLMVFDAQGHALARKPFVKQ